MEMASNTNDIGLTTRSGLRQCSNLTLPLAGLDSVSRTTTVAGTPVAETPASTHPFSAFYSHPQCAVSSEQRSTTSFEKDIEKGLPSPGQALHSAQASARPSFEPSITTTRTNTSLTTPIKPTSSCGKGKNYVSVWPAGSEVRQRKEDARRMKGCLLFRSLSRKQKIVAKICIAILILGIATAIGCAISYKT